MARKMKEGPYIATKRAKSTPGKTVRKGGTQVIKLSGIGAKIPIKKGALRAQLGAKTVKGPRGGTIKKPLSMALINRKIAALKKESRGEKKLSPSKLRLLRRLNLAKIMKRWHKGRSKK